ncbi:hypothetical protein LTR66_013877, partial [Elasticomyces elasticus]
MPNLEHLRSVLEAKASDKTGAAIEFACQAERLAHLNVYQEDENTGSTQAVEAKFVTAQDPVIVTANGKRLPAVPVDEAVKLNKLKDVLEDREPSDSLPVESAAREAKDGTVHGARPRDVASSQQSQEPEATLRESIPSRTNPLFPPLPMYGPPHLMRDLQCYFFRATSALLSLQFLLVIVLGAAFTSIPLMFDHIRLRLLFRNPEKRRPFYGEETRRREIRRESDKAWTAKGKAGKRNTPEEIVAAGLAKEGDEFIPTEGGPDPIVCDIGYYARRVGLDVETFDVQTEDGFIIDLWHLYNPLEYKPHSQAARAASDPDTFHTEPTDPRHAETSAQFPDGKKRYPILLIHGLLQSAGAYCTNDDRSLAFYLHKSGYDVWLGNNRCGFRPRHTLLSYSDPRMWAWNIRQMGVMDLPALVSRVLAETGFPKLGLVAHSQGTTQTFVALAKEQRPELGGKIAVFCALAPAAYAGPLIGKMYFKFMRVVPPTLFKCIFGIHSFIPFMLGMHAMLPGRLYGAMGYRVFSFLFDWTDTRWERDLRDRGFMFAPVYVSSESMRWWLGRECFAQQKCILATREEGRLEDEEDEEEDDEVTREYYRGKTTVSETGENKSGRQSGEADHGTANASTQQPEPTASRKDDERGRFAWYD